MAIETGWQDTLKQLAWLPNWALCVGIFTAATLLALAVHAAAYRVLTRVARDRGLFQRSLVARTQGVTRFGLVALSLEVAANAAPLTPQAAALTGHALQVVFIGFMGWVALQAVHVGAVVYTRRFKLDADDNLLARRHVTQVRILQRLAGTMIGVLTLAAALMTFPGVRQYGVSLLASAGVAGVILGLALQSIFANLMAGLQIAVTQPIRIDDAVVVEGEMGWIEEISSVYVVIRLWDRRRLIVPLNYFIEKPFQNWTRETASLIGSVLLRLDYTVPVEALRARLKEIVKETPLWDGDVVNLQVTDATAQVIEIRILVSARNSAACWDLRCFVREKMIEFLRDKHPEALPRQRNETAATAVNGSGEGAHA